MEEKRPLSDTRAQAAIDDARIAARKEEILGPSALPSGSKAATAAARAAAATNPSWLTPHPETQPAKPPAAASRKKKAPARRQPAKQPIRDTDVWKRAMDDETNRQAED